jgi:hypothetical protein
MYLLPVHHSHSQKALNAGPGCQSRHLCAALPPPTGTSILDTLVRKTTFCKHCVGILRFLLVTVFWCAHMGTGHGCLCRPFLFHSFILPYSSSIPNLLESNSSQFNTCKRNRRTNIWKRTNVRAPAALARLSSGSTRIVLGSGPNNTFACINQVQRFFQSLKMTP